MEIKKPTLEEVKEYFKNAKEVRNKYGHRIIVNQLKLEYSENKDFIYCFDNNIIFFEKGVYAEIISYKDEIQTPTHYDNSKGSIYQFCENQNLNSYEFDIIKRVVRSRKKGNFKEDLEKTKVLIDLYLKEYEEIN